MEETKNQAFHRLASRRVEEIEDKLRVFSNLSSSNYELTQEELNSYLARIQTSIETLTQRFAEAKRWNRVDPVVPPAPPAPLLTSTNNRQAQMLAIWEEANNDQGALVEMLAMQREVIKKLQASLDEERS